MSPKTLHLIILLCTTTLLTGLMSGCADMPPVLSSQSSPGDLPAIEYVRWVQTADNKSLQKEQYRLADNGDAESIIDQTQLAILLSASTMATDDAEERALQLLTGESITQNIVRKNLTSREKNYLELGEVWKTVLNQQLATQKAVSNNSELEKQITDLKKKNTELQEKLNTLSSIEEQLMEREQSNTEK